MDVYYQQLPSDAFNKCVAVVDIGAVLMLVSVVLGGETIYTRDQVFGGDQYTNSIVAYYNKSFDEAEIGKTTGDLPPNYTFEVLAPFQTSLLQQVRRAVQMFLTTSGKDQIDYIVLTGGTAMIDGSPFRENISDFIKTNFTIFYHLHVFGAHYLSKPLLLR